MRTIRILVPLLLLALTSQAGRTQSNARFPQMGVFEADWIHYYYGFYRERSFDAETRIVYMFADRTQGSEPPFHVMPISSLPHAQEVFALLEEYFGQGNMWEPEADARANTSLDALGRGLGRFLQALSKPPQDEDRARWRGLAAKTFRRGMDEGVDESRSNRFARLLCHVGFIWASIDRAEQSATLETLEAQLGVQERWIGLRARTLVASRLRLAGRIEDSKQCAARGLILYRKLSDFFGYLDLQRLLNGDPVRM